MLVKIFSQIILAASIFQIMPADAANFEYRVGIGSAFDASMTANELQIATLPESQNREGGVYPIKVRSESYGIVTSAKSAVVIDTKSGMILLGKHPYEVRSIGSVTKLMTALVFLDQNPNLQEYKTLDWDLDLVEGGRIYLAFDNPITLNDLLAASIVGSDNTATKSLVRFSGLSEEDFISVMNQKAKDLGMDASIFVDPTGIKSGNVSTAMDLTKLLDAARDENHIDKFMTMPNVTVHHKNGPAINIESTNPLFGTILDEEPYSIIAGKTGYLPEAGYVLATSIERDGNIIDVIVLGSESKDTRTDDGKGLAYWAFKTFEWPN